MEFIDLLRTAPVVFFALAGIAGLFIGSFLNVVIHRLPIMLERRWALECAAIQDTASNSSADQPIFNLLVPRSRCPSCNTTVTAAHNIPVVSWLLLRGQCPNCSTKISAQYPLVELATAALTIVVADQFGVTAQFLFALVFLYALISLSGIDFKTTLLPDDITLPLVWLGLLANVAGLFTDLQSAVIGAASGYLVLWLVYHAFRLLTGKEGMGYGDFKLLAALGAWLGWQQLPLIILLSSLIGAVVGIGLIIVRGRDRNIPIPFGPYLAGAGFVAMLWGEQLTNYYLQYSAP